MLFSSYTFIFIFLPTAVLGWYLLNRWRRGWAVAALIVFSLVYYGWWNYRYIPLLLASMLANYALGKLIREHAAAGEARKARALLVAGIVANLALLGYFKYANFFLEVAGQLAGFGVSTQAIVLPLAISFYTFQQIAYLVDSHRQEVARDGLLAYLAFVSFFPHLIAGPILHHREMMPQFARRERQRFLVGNLSLGLTIFFIGLAKKVLIADPMSAYATPTFEAAAAGAPVDFYAAWIAALAYTFQLYFDFSGYSDMAVGAARMMGIRLPINFFSPYRATNIIDFWRRWHMTLSRFLRVYLYIPLGGNRKGPVRRHLNLFVTMLLGGLWHGAGWTFVAWGALHGAYLVANHAWQALRARARLGAPSAWGRGAGRVLTFLAVVVAWVFFRADDLPSALRLLSAMAGADGVALPARMVSEQTAAAWGVTVSSLPLRPLLLCGALLVFVWVAPNTYELTGDHEPAIMPRGFVAERAPLGRVRWRPSPAWACVLAGGVAGALLAMLSGRMEFLYYQF